MNIFIVVITTCIVFFTSYYILITYLADNSENEKKSVNTYIKDKKLLIYSIMMLIFLIAASVYMEIHFTENSIIFNIKRMTVLAIVWAAAYVDFTMYKIPNSLVISGLFYRAVILIAELIYENKGIISTFITELIAAAALLLAGFLCNLCIKNSVGMGDLKLLSIIGLLTGLKGIWGVVFTALLVSFVLIIFLLITKKKGRKDVIPFGPSIAIGAFLSIISSGM